MYQAGPRRFPATLEGLKEARAYSEEQCWALSWVGGAPPLPLDEDGDPDHRLAARLTLPAAPEPEPAPEGWLGPQAPLRHGPYIAASALPVPLEPLHPNLDPIPTAPVGAPLDEAMGMGVADESQIRHPDAPFPEREVTFTPSEKLEERVEKAERRARRRR